MKYMLCAMIGLGLSLGCSTDVAKVIEAKSMAVCACETTECLESVKGQFESMDTNPYGTDLSADQKKRIDIAQEKQRRCLANIKP